MVLKKCFEHKNVVYDWEHLTSCETIVKKVKKLL